MQDDSDTRPRGWLDRLLPAKVAKALPESLLGRQLLVISAVLVAGNMALLMQAEHFVRSDVMGSEQRRLVSVAQSIAPHLDGQAHEEFAEAAQGRGAWLEWSLAPAPVQQFHDRLSRLASFTEMDHPVATLRMRDEFRERVAAEPDRPHPKALEQLFTSAGRPEWRRQVDYRPEMQAAFFGGRAAVSNTYADDHGSWLSAYAPLADVQGNVVGIIVVTHPMEALLDRVWDRQKRDASLVLAMFLFVFAAIALTVRQLTAGLWRIEAAARRIGRGDYTTPVRAIGFKEVVRLARGLEQARQSVAMRTAQLESMHENVAKELREAQQQLDDQDRERRRRFAALKGKLRVTLEVGLRPLPVRLVDLGFDRIVVTVDRALAPDLAPGMAAKVYMVPPDGSITCRLKVSTRSTILHPDEAQINLAPLSPVLLEALPEDVRRIISQRKTLRIVPPPEHPCFAAVRRNPRLKAIEVKVLDISSGGLKIYVPVPFQRFSTWGSFLQVALRISGEDNLLHLGARIRNCQPYEDGSAAGIEFDAETTPGLEQQQQRISIWVMNRDRERREASAGSQAQAS